MHILSGMIGCSDLYEYAVDMLTNQRKRRKLLASGINGWVTLVCSLVIILFQVASPALFVMNIVLFIF